MKAEDFGYKKDDFLMNPHTGSVDTAEDWLCEAKDWEGDIEEQFSSLIKVVNLNGEWVEA